MDIHTVENVFIECVLLICQWISKEVKKRNGQRNWCVLLMPQKLFGLVTCKGSLKACFFSRCFSSFEHILCGLRVHLGPDLRFCNAYFINKSQFSVGVASTDMFTVIR